jgi:sigma-B regulation protein RsbU (phosphoserine phosphatase)
MLHILDESCRPETESARRLRHTFDRRLTELRISREIVDELTLVVAEITTNIIMHSQPAATWIAVRLSVAGAVFKLTIEDDGGPFSNFDEIAYQDLGLSMQATSGRGLPLVRSVLDAQNYVQGPPNRFEGERAIIKSRPKFLIIENEPAPLEAHRSMLLSLGNVIRVQSLSAAWTLVRREKVDLIITDYSIGDQSCISFLERMEFVSHELPAPVIVVAAEQDAIARRRLLELGVDSIVDKSVEPGAFREIVGLALRRAERRRLQHFRHFGSQIGVFLPEALPELLRGVSIHQRGTAADVGGGDFVLHLQGREFERLLLVDVMGHGLAAIRQAICLATMVRTIHGLYPDDNCATFLSRLSQVMNAEDHIDLIATVLVVDILDNHRFRVATAGHPPPIRLAAHAAEVLDVTGPLPGLVPGADYCALELRLKAGERLLLLTDGIDPEYVGAGHQMPAWFEASVLRASELDPAALLAQLSRDIATRHGGFQGDDWTIVALAPDGIVQPQDA